MTAGWPDYAGLRGWGRSRQTGTLIGLYDGEAAGMDTAAGRWQTVCEDHGTIISHETLALARAHAGQPAEWCESCTVKGRNPMPSKSRPAQWAEAVADAKSAVQDAKDAMANAASAFETLRDLQAEYQDWLDNLPDVSRGQAVEEKLQAVVDLDLEPDDTDLDAMESAADEAEGADLPLGFGRD